MERLCPRFSRIAALPLVAREHVHSPNYFSKSPKSEEKERLVAVYIGLTDI